MKTKQFVTLPNAATALASPSLVGDGAARRWGKKRDFDQKEEVLKNKWELHWPVTRHILTLIPIYWAHGYKMNKVQLVGNWRIVLHSEATNCTFHKKKPSSPCFPNAQNSLLTHKICRLGTRLATEQRSACRCSWLTSERAVQEKKKTKHNTQP